MADLTFIYRHEAETPLSEERPGFLRNGSIVLDDGFVTDEFGNTTTFAMVRITTPPSTQTYEWKPVNFYRGSIGLKTYPKATLVTTSSTAHQFTDGRLTLDTTGLSSGALTDFAFWPAGGVDPKEFYIESATGDVNSGGVTQSHTRINATFVPHRNAKYLGVGGKVYAVPNTGTWRNQYFKKWMLEKAHIGGTFPTTKYAKAREVVVSVRPDRLNYIRNPSFETATTHWAPDTGAPTLAVSGLRAKYGTSSAILTTTVASDDNAIYQGTDIVMPAGEWTLSWWVWSPIFRTAYFDVAWAGGSSNGSALPRVNVPAEQWTRVHRTFTLPTATTFTMYLHHKAATSQAIGATLHVDGILLERGPELRDYFDGSSSGDTVWESGGTAGLARSYLYKNRVERYAAMLRVLEDNVPLGIGIADPKFGVLPAD